MPLSQLKQQLSGLQTRQQEVEVSIKTSERERDEAVTELRRMFGDKIPEDITKIPFEDLDNEIATEYNTLEGEATTLLNDIHQALVDAEQKYDIANGSATN